MSAAPAAVHAAHPAMHTAVSTMAHAAAMPHATMEAAAEMRRDRDVRGRRRARERRRSCRSAREGAGAAHAEGIAARVAIARHAVSDTAVEIAGVQISVQHDGIVMMVVTAAVV